MADFLTCNSELKYASPAALPQFAIYIIALVESGKCLTRIGCISIYLPCADALAVSALVSDETGNICQRISEEYADLMGNLISLLPSAQVILASRCFRQFSMLH